MSTDRFIMISQSGRRWVLGETDSRGRPTTRADAERIAAEMGFTLEVAEAPCRCGRPARGDVAADGIVPAHVCRQCSPQHCEMAAYVRNRAESE